MSTLEKIVAGHQFNTESGTSSRFKRLAPVIRCKDGASISVQASRIHACTPRNDLGPYIRVEAFKLSCQPPDSWKAFKSDHGVYEYVPVGYIYQFLYRHGGEA